MRLTTLTFCILAFSLTASAPIPLESSKHLKQEHAFWGLNGHRIVAAVAENHLTPEAKKQVQKLLKGQPMARVSVWADEARGKKKWSFTRTWHYTTIPEGETYKKAEKHKDGDVITALRKYEAVLRSNSAAAEEKTIALKFFIHFAGDVHQPLHVGNGKDRGGNDVKVDWYNEKDVRLHSVWDSHIIRHTELSYTEFVDFIDRATQSQIEDWQNSTYTDWAMESYEVRDMVYNFRPARSSNERPYLSWDYRNAAVPIIEERLLKAGIRLAGVLNDIFSGTS